ncbi:hypothetical protein [Bacillus cereus]|uniref:O-antigen ligase like membrane family protein n=1 Tax=Bacillus cereus 03BB108 TaxID=451709 RepID=A0AAN0SQN2_BACCE|nr:hypothetical protein [Bacillus cereus]AJI08595.1 O-antigen ligase like membrane family protein [Bacillus cereus 03BB108]EDX59473.1 conserved hypothetical protein [Bacillus cereus 03BB108]QKG99269.1 hypothetical protein FOC96_03095 [Bacillus cereus]
MSTFQQRKESVFLIMLFPLVLALIPRPEIEGAQFLTYPAIGAILFAISLFHLKNLQLNTRLTYFVTLIFCYTFSISLSVMFANEISSSSFFHIIKPLLFIIILVFGFIVGKRVSYENIVKGLLISVKLVLLAQIIVGVPQLLSITMFDVFYSSEMSRPLGQLTRMVGTLSNPNIFAWIVIQSSVIVFLFEKRKFRRLLWLSIGLGLILLSGSRTSFVLLPAIIFSCSLLLAKKNVKFFLVKVPFYIVLLVISFYAMIWFLEEYQYTFPYLHQLLQIMDTGQLTSVSSFNTRTYIWSSAWSEFLTHESLKTWLFGLGPGFITWVDSDYLYSLFTYGIIGFSLNIMIYLSMFIMFTKMKQREFKVLGQQYIIFSFAIGYQAETLVGWNYPLLIMFYTGLAIAILKNNKNITAEENK